MRIFTTGVLTVCLCVASGWAGLTPVGGSKKDATAGKAVNGLQFGLTGDVSEIILKGGKIAKPAALKLTFSNVSDKPIRFNAYGPRRHVNAGKGVPAPGL